MTAQEVLAALECRYSSVEGEWVGWREAWGIDYLVQRCWTGGIGQRRVACEIKVSRSDFRAELRKPHKRQRALAMSHQMFFVVPRRLVRTDEVPPECGLLYVNDDLTTRLAKKAPLREPRPLKMSEVVYLMRLPLLRSGMLDMRREIRAFEAREEYALGRATEARERLEAAESRLALYAGDLAVEGSVWRGIWRRWDWGRDYDGQPVECYVERVEDRGYGRLVDLRTLDGLHSWRWLPVGEFLARFEPVADADSRTGSVSSRTRSGIHR